MYAVYTIREENNGGYNDGDPPLTIPNREVKPISADDTAIPSGKVGSRQLYESIQVIGCSFFVIPSSALMRVFFFIKSSRDSTFFYNTLKSTHAESFLFNSTL